MDKKDNYLIDKEITDQDLQEADSAEEIPTSTLESTVPPLETPLLDRPSFENEHQQLYGENTTKLSPAEQSSKQDENNDVPPIGHPFEDLLETGFAQILDAFEQKLAYDITKQQQIDRLHGELQQHRTDLIAKTNRPIINGLIQLYEDIAKLVVRLNKKSEDELTPELFLHSFSDIREDIEILLDQNGIITYSEPDEIFQPKRQRAVKRVSTTEDNKNNNVAERLGPGFEQGSEIIKKERVTVYVLDKTVSSKNNISLKKKTELPPNQGEE